MDTHCIFINPEKIEEKLVSEAGACLRAGGVVAIPTETVYGLGANGLDEEAVRKVFSAKGRPSDNPLILHITAISDIENIAVLTDKAKLLFEHFSPGPLTVVMKKKGIVPSVISAGLDTVAVRIPSHPVARAVIAAAGVPVAAPSANLSGSPSPTRAEHVLYDLNGKIDMIVDGGPCEVGLESTVVDMTGDKPVILRPGAISAKQIRELLGDVVEGAVLPKDGAPKSPGMKYRHYAPKAQVVVVEGDPGEVACKTRSLLKEYTAQGKKTAVFAASDTKDYAAPLVICGGAGAREYAKGLFNALRKLDEAGADVIFTQIIWQGGISDAIRNRLYKAASKEKV